MRPSSSDSDPRRAFSLLELIVYCALLMFLLAGVYLLLTTGVRYFRTGTSYQTAQQQALIAMRKLERELCNSTERRNLYDVDWVIFLSPERPVGTSGPWTHDGTDQLYHKWVCFYHDSGSRQLRRVEDGAGFSPPNGLSSANAPASPGIATFKAQAPEVVARGITSLQITPGDSQDMLRVLLYAQDETGGSTNAQDRFTEVQLQTQIRMYND